MQETKVTLKKKETNI